MINVEILINVWIGLVLIIFFTAWLLWGYATIVNLMLIKYLRVKKPKRFKGAFGNFFNPLPVFDYIENNLDIGDKKILRYKKTLRFATKTAVKLILVAFSLLFSGVAIIVLFKI